MIDLLARTAAVAPDRVAVVTDLGEATYGELAAEARSVAAALIERGLSRVAIVEPDARLVIALLAGAASAGVEACQYLPDLDPDEFAVQAQANGHDQVITRRSDLVGELIDPEALTSGVPTDHGHPGAAVQQLLILTTGSTGQPKAARHDWRVLAGRLEEVAPTPEWRWLLAYGLHQFAGLQVVLHVLASGSTLVAPFPRQPRDGLRAITELGVDAVSATPTYWRFLLAEARGRGATMPPLRQITLGGEAASEALLLALRDWFPAARITHVYASTEVGSVLAVNDGRPGFDAALLRSPQRPEGRLEIRDGELWVRGSAGMVEYAGQATLAPFSADADGWRPTGDLVEVVGERVHFRGRDSEVINVGGVKVHPLPVEERIAAVAGVAMVRVYGRANKLTGAIVAAEIVAEQGVVPDELRAAVRDAVADLPRAWQPRSLQFVEQIKTVGSKTIRRVEA
ncbi:AMP-binding protein [Nocardioides dubius]|uniref:Long-chain-fatty-acid--CoA ligase n=1 Tax=Nocardioides dubius TaxID=317019 RepID=A0ABN1U369_9ACTN